MEKLFMSAGVIVAIVFCIISIIKSPFKNIKNKHPKGYKALFTGLSFIFAIGLSILDELFILCGEILSIDFAILVCTVIAGVFSGYCGVYEGLGLKELEKMLISKLKNVIKMSKNKKIVKYLNKIEDIENAIAVLEERKNNQVNEV